MESFRYPAYDQPRWVTNGLLDEADQMRNVSEEAE
jgi:hypothetical protein